MNNIPPSVLEPKFLFFVPLRLLLPAIKRKSGSGSCSLTIRYRFRGILGASLRGLSDARHFRKLFIEKPDDHRGT